MAARRFRNAAFTGAPSRSVVSNDYFKIALRSGVSLLFAVMLLQGVAGLFGARRDFAETARRIAALRQDNIGNEATAALALAGSAPAATRPLAVLNVAGERDALPDASGSEAPSAAGRTALELLGMAFLRGGDKDPVQRRCASSGCARTDLLASLLQTPTSDLPSRKELLVRHFGQVVDLDRRKYSKYDRFFKKYVRKYFGDDIDWRWFKAQAFVESNLKKSSRSHAGAIGVMQILPETFQHIQRANRFFRGKSVYRPEWNIAAGIYYSRLLMNRIKPLAAPEERLPLMFACYNAGPTRILGPEGEQPEAPLRLARVLPLMPRETREYLKKINVLMLSLESPAGTGKSTQALGASFPRPAGDSGFSRRESFRGELTLAANGVGPG